MNKLEALTHAVTKCLRDSPQTQIVFTALMDHLVDISDELESLPVHAGLQDRLKSLANRTEDLRLAVRSACLDNPMRFIH